MSTTDGPHSVAAVHPTCCISVRSEDLTEHSQSWESGRREKYPGSFTGPGHFLPGHLTQHYFTSTIFFIEVKAAVSIR